MTAAALIGLGLKLALGSDRGAKLRFTLMALSIGLGVAVILGAFSAIPAIQARDARSFGLNAISTEEQGDASDLLILTERNSYFEGRRLRRLLVAPIGSAPVPPGLDRLPGLGEVVVSPALQELLEGPKAELLDDRLRGRVVGVIEGSGLQHPEELTAYLGVHPEEIEEVERAFVTGFGLPEGSEAGVPTEVVQSVIFGSMGVLLPVLVFVWTATRLSARLREERLGAIRLAGATPRQVQLLSAVESGLAALVGTGIGFVILIGARQLLAIPVELGLEPTDAFPPIWALVGVILGVPILAVIVAWVALRRVTRSPLSVVHKAPRRSRVAGPAAVALAIGLGLWLSLDWAYRRWGDTGPWIFFILGAWILTSFGVLGLAPWIGTRAAGWVVGRSESVGAWLGARRLEWDGRAASRVSAATVAVVFAAGITSGYLVFLEGSSGLRSAATLRSETIVVDSWAGDLRQALDEIAAVEGVASTAVLRTTHVAEATTHNFIAEITVLSCGDLGGVLLSTPSGCATGAILQSNPEATNVLALARSRVLEVFIPYPEEEYVPFQIDVADRLPSTSFAAGTASGYVIDEAALRREALDALPATRILVSTDGRAETAERIREAVAWTAPYPRVLTRSELAADELVGSIPVRLAIELGTYFALSVAAASLLVSTVGAVQDRRKPLAALAALGVPAGALRRSVLVQTMAPLVTGVVMAGTAAAVVVLATPVDRGIPWMSLVAPIGRFVVLAVVAGLVASALAFPSLRRGIRPEALHHE